LCESCDFARLTNRPIWVVAASVMLVGNPRLPDRPPIAAAQVASAAAVRGASVTVEK
jgi:hypothetical protein